MEGTTRETKSENKVEIKQDNKYAILMETSGKHCESWYYFIKYNGNEEALNDLQKQLEKIDFYILGDLSTFDLELEHLVSETTAKEMINIDLNHYSFHRKFDGKMQKVDLGLKKKYNNLFIYDSNSFCSITNRIFACGRFADGTVRILRCQKK